MIKFLIKKRYSFQRFYDNRFSVRNRMFEIWLGENKDTHCSDEILNFFFFFNVFNNHIGLIN